MNQAELAAALEAVDTKLDAVGAQLTKAQGEITKTIDDLKAVIAAGGGTSPEVDAALTKLQTAVAALSPVAQSLDDITPDA
jgi:ABC-type transporter Mla subunit MlaD